MNFLEAMKYVQDGRSVRRPKWEDGISACLHTSGKYIKESRSKPYLGTYHSGACELGGVRLMEDLLATDWQLTYPEF